jgi:predicted membrane metal-binding protein
MSNKNPLLSFSAIFLLLPCFTMPYFQIWYVPFLFGYALIPQKKREKELTVLWLIFMTAMLSFGGVSFNPLNILDGWKKVLGL